MKKQAFRVESVKVTELRDKKMRMMLMLWAVVYGLWTVDLNADAPKKVKDGLEFSYSDPKAKSVHLAGDFNSWAENQEGKVNRPEFLMVKGKDGVWRKTVKVGGGKHAYKFVVDGSNWVSDPSVKEMDKDGNSILVVEGVPSAPAASAASLSSGEFAPKEVSGGVKFMYKGNAKKVTVAGQFNKWSMDATAMKEEKAGILSVIVALPVGNQLYKFVVDGQWILDPANPLKGTDGGIENSLVKVTKGVAPAADSSASGPKKVPEGWEFSFKAPQARSVHLAGDFNNWAENQSGSVNRPEFLMTKGSDGIWRKTVKLSPGQHTYKFVSDGNQWSPDPNNSAPRDKDDNSTFVVP